MDDFYGWIFERSVPGLPAAAAGEGLTPLAYMRKHGAFLVEDEVYWTHEWSLGDAQLQDATVDPVTKVIVKGGAAIGVEIDGQPLVGFPTPSRKLELYSPDAEGLEVAGVRPAGLHPEPRPLVPARPGEERVLPAADLPAADADPHALGQREVALRDLAQQPASGSIRGMPSGSRWAPTTW